MSVQMLTRPYALDQMDGWTCLYMAPTSTPGQYAPRGGVFRGFDDEARACSYMREAAAFFARHGLDQPVFVVRGPTSTSRCKFEVVDATAGYGVVARERIEPAKHPSAGMSLRTAVACFGLAAVRGLPLDDGSGRTLYVHERCLQSDLDCYADSPTEAFRIHRMYGGDASDAALVEWIYTNTSRVTEAATAPHEADAPPAPRA